jgi:hypothetical protein
MENIEDQAKIKMKRGHVLTRNTLSLPPGDIDSDEFPPPDPKKETFGSRAVVQMKL